MSEPAKSQKEYSASSLGKELGIDSKEIFQKLVNLKYIIKKGDTWELTPLGKNKGGQYKDSTYGKYIAWPESLVSEIKVEANPQKGTQSNPPGFIKTQNVPGAKPSLTKEEQTIILKTEAKQTSVPPGKGPAQYEDKTITATGLGKQYDLPPSRINSIFSELGWIAKDIKGWQITDLGKRVGGIQSRDLVSGVRMYVGRKQSPKIRF